MKKNYISFLILSVIALLTFISCDKEVSRSPAEPEPPKGFIFVESEPAGFKIYLDGRFTGRFTPDSIPFVEETLHDVTLKRAYWRDTSLSVEAREGDLATLDVNYLTNPKMYGDVRFMTNPEGAQIIFDGTLLNGITPYTLESILPGRYNVEFVYPKHRGNIATVIVKSNQTSTTTIALRDTSIWVDYNFINSPLPTNVLTAVSVDEENYVWIGTIDKGVVKHKGNKWEIINSTNSLLPNNRIRNIFTDSQNNKWIGTDGGLLHIDRNRISTAYTAANSGLPNDIINDFVEDENGTIWIATQNGLAKYVSGNFDVINSSNSNMPKNQVRVIEPIASNQLWAAIDTFVTLYENNRFEIFPSDENDFPNLNMTGIDIASNGNTWAVFSTIFIEGKGNIIGGLAYYDGIWHSTKIGVASTRIYDIYIDRNDDKWLCSNDGLLLFEDLNTSSAYRPNNSGIISQDARSIYQAEDGTLWIATGGGLAKYKRQLETE